MAGAAHDAGLDDLQAEMIDRFGPLPPPARTLLQIHRLRNRALALGIRRLELGATAGVIEFAREHRVDPQRVIRLVQRKDGRYRLDGQQRLRIKLAAADAARRIAEAGALLEELGG